MKTLSYLQRIGRSGAPVLASSVLVAAANAGGCGGQQNSGSGGSGGDAGCLCPGAAPAAPTTHCTDGTVGGPVCGPNADGFTCSWTVRACPDASACPGLGCFPSCANGVLKDSNGCDTCQCSPAPDASPSDAVVSGVTTPDATTPGATTPEATTPEATTPEAATPDATTPDASPMDAGTPEASTSDGTTRDAADGGSCLETIPAYCAADASSCVDVMCPCVIDWATASNPSQWCTSPPYDPVYMFRQCDGFNLVVVRYADSSSFYYYDPVTLKLVRVEDHGGLGSLCVAGQPGPVVPLTDCYDGAAPKSVCSD